MNDDPDAGGSGGQLEFFHADGRPTLAPPAGNPTACELYRFENLWRAYRECRRTKRGTLNALAFEWDAEAGLLELQEELLEHRYRPGRSICFITEGAKPREVFAADFRDRIVHHLLLGRIEPSFERRFIHDSYACRKGKGVLAASDRLTAFLRQATAGGTQRAWAVKLDVASFFPSIDKDVLYEVLCRTVRDAELRWLIATILFHDPTGDYVFHRGPKRVAPPWSSLYTVEPRKSLFGRGGRTGLPIGNLTSQFWANCYLNELDQFVKRRLRCRWYVRYVDDLVLLAQDPADLERWRDAIGEFLGRSLRLSLRAEPAEPVAVRRGIDFVGWRTWHSHRLPRQRTVTALENRTVALRDAMVKVRPGHPGVDLDLTTRLPRAPGAVQFDAAVVETLLSILAFYAGHLRGGSSWAKWQRLWHRNEWLDLIFRREGWHVALRWPDRCLRAPRLWQQYWRLASAAPPGMLVFCPVGRYVEFRRPFLEQASAVLGLRRCRLPRGQWLHGAGFPVALAHGYEGRARRRGWAVAVVRQGQWRGRRCCHARSVVRVRIPA